MRYQTTARRSREQIEREIASAQRHLEGYLLMFGIAQDKGMEYEQERILASIREYTTEVEYLTGELGQ